MTKVNLPITGICSFAKCPIAQNLETLEADFGVLGVPYDVGVGFLSGTRFGPRRIREASTQYSRGGAGFYDPERGETYLAAPIRIVDCGDADIVTGDIDASFANIESAVRAIAERGVVPAVMGGDHSISIPVARALSNKGPLEVVHFDAHLDWSRGPATQRYSNGTPLRHMSTMAHITGMTQVGMRGMGSSTREDFEEAKAWGSRIITCREAMAMGAEAAMAQVPGGAKYYVSIDIDSLDITTAPGTGSPMPGGFSFNQLLDMLEALSRKGEIVCFDLVEVAPQYDPAGITPRIAALIMLYFMGFIRKRQLGG